MISKRKEIAAAFFNRAAHTYDTAAVVQRTVGCRLAERIGQLTLPSRPAVLEIGCGTGLFTRAALDHINPSTWLATDISPVMVANCREYFVSDVRFLFACMDGETPATEMGTGFDLICANLVAQWFDDLAGSLERLARLVRAGGWLVFTTLAAGTFAEWIETHRQLGLTAGTPIYPDTASLAHQWPSNGEGAISGEVIRHTYPNAHTFVAALKTIGAHATERQPLPTGAFRRVLRTFDGSRPVAMSYHVVYGVWRRNGSGGTG